MNLQNVTFIFFFVFVAALTAGCFQEDYETPGTSGHQQCGWPLADPPPHEPIWLYGEWPEGTTELIRASVVIAPGQEEFLADGSLLLIQSVSTESDAPWERIHSFRESSEYETRDWLTCELTNGHQYQRYFSVDVQRGLPFGVMVNYANWKLDSSLRSSYSSQVSLGGITSSSEEPCVDSGARVEVRPERLTLPRPEPLPLTMRRHRYTRSTPQGLEVVEGCFAEFLLE